MVDSEIYSNQIEKKYIQNWRDRIGYKMELEIRIVKDIPVEKSGKFRIVKNKIRG